MLIRLKKTRPAAKTRHFIIKLKYSPIIPHITKICFSELKIDHISVKSLKIVREKVTKVRWTIERSQMIQYEYIESPKFMLLKPSVDCFLSIYLDEDMTAIKENVIEYSSYCLHLKSSREFGNFDCKLWIENESAVKRHVSYLIFLAYISSFSQSKHY
jgi:hypothetical protein